MSKNIQTKKSEIYTIKKEIDNLRRDVGISMKTVSEVLEFALNNMNRFTDETWESQLWFQKEKLRKMMNELNEKNN